MVKREHPTEARDRAMIRRAVCFTAYFRRGPFEKHRQRYDAQPDMAAALAAARQAARDLEAMHGGHGRRAAVYAVTPEGWTFIVPPDFTL